MIDGEPSRTAFGAAMLRALHQETPEPRIFTDPLAWRILGNRDELLAEADDWRGSRLQSFIAVRHRFAEDSLATAVRRGTRQVVVLGAGLDTLAYRFPDPEVRFFEVDFPATGSWKRERLAASAIAVPDTVAYVGVDFESEPFLAALLREGFDAAAPAFFVWLGVVPYLSRDAVEATLRAIGTVPGGEVVFDHTEPSGDVPQEAVADRQRLEARVADLGEPLTTGWRPAELHALLTGVGLSEIEDLDRSAIRERYLGRPADGRPGGAHVVRARRPG